VVAGAAAVGGLAAAGVSELAVLQAFLMPLLWTVLPTTRSAIAANVVLCLAISAGFVVSLGWSRDTAVTAATSEGLSLMFSIALGLWITTIARTGAERGRLLDELRAAQDELAAHHRETGTVAERERLAREIHDTVAQSLTGLVMLSQQARSSLASGDAAAGLARLELIESSARDALTDARTLVAATASSGLDGGDLADALRRLGGRFARESGVAVTVDVAPGPALPRDQQVVVVRVVQEALANVRKHSGSRSAHVALGPAPVATGDGAGVGLVLSVRDEGRGFDADAPHEGFGLDGLADRLRLAGGSLVVESGDGGTTVTALLPGQATT
jgi:signal transduction histidine kinase